jgi:hypothetical protein
MVAAVGPDRLPAGATDLILSEATRMGRRYHPAIPLVEPADQRLKLARLAAACAARVHSTDPTGEQVIVKQEHVAFVVGFLERVYNGRSMAYGEYSDQQRGQEELDPDSEEAIRRVIPAAELETINDNIGLPVFYNLAFVSTDNIGTQDAEILVQLKENQRGFMSTEHYWKSDLTFPIEQNASPAPANFNFDNILDDYLGIYNINDETLSFLHESLVTGIDLLKLRKYAKIGAPLNSASINSIAVSSAAADRVEIYMTLNMPKPLNRIEDLRTKRGLLLGLDEEDFSTSGVFWP